MPTLSFEGDTHDELVRKVRRWLDSADGQHDHLDLPEAVERASEVTKDALTVIAQSAPAPIARSELVKAVTRMGHEATDSTKKAVIAGIDALSDTTEDDVLKRIEKAGSSVAYEMNAGVARQVLRLLAP